MASDITWFVHHKDAHTNEVIARFIEGTYGFESELVEVICEDGKRRKMWEVSWQDAQHLWNSIIYLGLKLSIFNQRGNGKIRDVTLIFTNNFKKGRRLKGLTKLQTQKKLF